MPIKAIEASILSRKNKQKCKNSKEFSTKASSPRTAHSKRRDVIHKAFFRAMKRFYSDKFQKSFGATEITKEEFKNQVISFTDSTVMRDICDKAQMDMLAEDSKASQECSKQGMMNVMMTLISHKLAKNW